MKRSNNLSTHKGSFWENIKARHAQKHLMSTVKKMQLWASKIDTKYFGEIDKKTLLAFTKESENFVYLLQMMYRKEIQSMDNPLIQTLRAKNTEFNLPTLLEAYAKDQDINKVDTVWKDEKEIIWKIEITLKSLLSSMKPGQYSQSEIIEFYENISLRRNVWNSLLSCQNLMKTLDFKVLERSRF
jgi:hypothetical protein